METLQRTANRGSISTGYEIENSLKLEEDNSEYLERATTGSGGSGTKHTISVWVKRTEITKTSFILGFANIGILRFDSADRIEYSFRSGRKLETNRLFRDTSAWYHIVVVADSSQATDTNRMRLWVNGVQETSFFFFTAQDLNQGSPAWGNYPGYNFRIGYSGNAGENFNGYIADAYYINGQTLDPTDFGEFDDDSGIWKPKAFTGTLGSLDNYLDFSNSSNLGEDANGGTDLSLNNITSADQAVDTPTNSFCTWNPLFSFGGNEAVINEGATTADSVSGGWKGAVGTIAATNGKWYWEYRPVAGAFGYRAVGIMGADYSTDDIDDPRDYCPNLFLRDGLSPYIYQHLISGVETAYKAMTSWSSNDSDVFAIALNLDDEEITFYRNGTAITENGTSNTTFSISSVIGQSEPIVPYYRSFDSTEIYFNFGGYTEMTIASGNTDANGYGTFEYAPPSGYYALCTKNLAEYG